MSRRGLACMLLVWAVAASGCAYEKRVSVSSAEPEWMSGAPSSADRFIFVGKGLGDNIVDTRQAKDRAMQDVRDKVAKSLTARAVALAIEIVEQKGVAHKSADEERAAYARLVQQQVNQTMTGMPEEASYWEKWMIKADLFTPGFSRFEYYVEITMPKEQYGKLAADLADQIASDIEARAQQPSPAAPTEGAGAPKP